MVSPLLRSVGTIVRSTHERWDGSGYPDGLAAGAIPLAARVIAACDAWDAMTSDRAYRPARSAEEAHRGARAWLRDAVRPGGRAGARRPRQRRAVADAAPSA